MREKRGMGCVIKFGKIWPENIANNFFYIKAMISFHVAEKEETLIKPAT